MYLYTKQGFKIALKPLKFSFVQNKASTCISSWRILSITILLYKSRLLALLKWANSPWSHFVCTEQGFNRYLNDSNSLWSHFMSTKTRLLFLLKRILTLLEAICVYKTRLLSVLKDSNNHWIHLCTKRLLSLPKRI